MCIVHGGRLKLIPVFEWRPGQSEAGCEPCAWHHPAARRSYYSRRCTRPWRAYDTLPLTPPPWPTPRTPVAKTKIRRFSVVDARCNSPRSRRDQFRWKIRRGVTERRAPGRERSPASAGRRRSDDARSRRTFADGRCARGSRTLSARQRQKRTNHRNRTAARDNASLIRRRLFMFVRLFVGI